MLRDVEYTNLRTATHYTDVRTVPIARVQSQYSASAGLFVNDINQLNLSLQY
jgi:hypothetical protein